MQTKQTENAKQIRLLTTAALFVALDIVVARFFGFEVPTPFGPIKADFQLIVAALCGYMLGPWWACLTLVSSDLLGVMLNSGSMGIFLGFTLSAAARGLLFGFFLHGKTLSPARVLLSGAVVYITVDLLANTLWLSILLGSSYLPLLAARTIPKLAWMTAELAMALAFAKLFSVVQKRRRA